MEVGFQYTSPSEVSGVLPAIAQHELVRSAAGSACVWQCQREGQSLKRSSDQTMCCCEGIKILSLEFRSRII